MARDASEERSLGGRARERRSHVGYYLVDKGRSALEKAIGYVPSMSERVRAFLLHFPDYSYLVAIEILDARRDGGSGCLLARAVFRARWSWRYF